MFSPSSAVTVHFKCPAPPLLYSKSWREVHQSPNPAASSKLNPPRTLKRSEVETNSLKHTRGGSTFNRRETCNKDIPVGLIDTHSCSLDSKIKMNIGCGDGYLS
ncbi:hypothetical protein MRB53_018707 [Persea americana]|uniref:Uncharacterized protein n=1 Tax=Persea americana TaxID=3435 RepID=A0ACC2M9A3_PERAE|nr:hypothetical protein MRB53_018707 [Persea americana]